MSAEPRGLSPRRVAEAIGASEASVKRWVDRGLLESVRTPGGHRRIPLASAVAFLRASGRTAARPELLGLPTAAGRGELDLEEGRAWLVRALTSGDADLIDSLIVRLHLGSHGTAHVFDAVVAPAFHEIGRLWERGALDVYRERRACTCCVRALNALRRLLPAPAPDAPNAIGGTLCGDPYELPSMLVELALRDAGWRAENLGIGQPTETWIRALDDLDPRLLWISVSTPTIESAGPGLRELEAACAKRDVAMVVGGRGLEGELRAQVARTPIFDRLEPLIAFLQGLRTV